MKKIKKEHGITLVALVITIVVLLILAGISIQAITQNNLFEQAKKAKNATENSQKEENKTLSEYMDKMNEYIPETLASKLNSGEIAIGAYVKYIPDAIDVNSEEYKTLVSNWGETYSGSTNNSSANLIQDKTLNWRVLDIKDGKVRLISDKPTSNTLELGGYQGYNNAVYLLDSACRILYNSTLTSKVQNLKIEDIQDKLVEKDYTKFDSNYGKIYSPLNKAYPIIIEEEKNQIINEENNNKINQSEQNELIKQNETKKAISWNLRYTRNSKVFEENEFVNNRYYELFINDGKYQTYWLSSRGVFCDSDNAVFDIRSVYSGYVGASGIYGSDNGANLLSYCIRPVITLNTDVKVDLEETKDGNSAETAYVLK